MPSAAFICPTFGRFPQYGHLLGECVESFRRQVVPAGWTASLLILNDAPEQTLTCDVIGVTIVNEPVRYASLGAKYNRLIELAPADIYLPAEDDDVSLPHRLSQAIARLADGSAYFNPQASWFHDGRQLHFAHQHGVCHNASCFTHDVWRRVGGYPERSGDQDVVMDRRLKSVRRSARPLSPTEPATWSYVYCWNRSNIHLSGNNDHEAAWQREAAKVRQPGTFRIEPQWRLDYSAECFKNYWR